MVMVRILSVKQSVSIDTVINFDGDGDGHGDGDVTCKQAPYTDTVKMTLRVNRPLGCTYLEDTHGGVPDL